MARLLNKTKKMEQHRANSVAADKGDATHMSCLPERPQLIIPFLRRKYKTPPRMPSSSRPRMMATMIIPLPSTAHTHKQGENQIVREVARFDCASSASEVQRWVSHWRPSSFINQLPLQNDCVQHLEREHSDNKTCEHTNVHLFHQILSFVFCN